MESYGFYDSNIPPERYEEYRQMYAYCSSSANSKAKQQCSYGTLAKHFYDKCMLKFGFNQYGEKTYDYNDNGDYFDFDF